MATAQLNIDTQLLSDFIYALNIARRQILSYPPGHPVIAAASGKLLSIIPRLLEFRPSLTIGIARNVLMVDGQQLDAANPVYRDFAASMFEARVASLTVSREITDDEVRRFFEILRHKPQALADSGGLDRLLAASGFRGIQARGIDFGAFHATELDKVAAPGLAVSEGESAVLWKAFVNGLVDGSLDPDGVRSMPSANFDPEDLAELINQRQLAAADRSLASYEQAITDFLKQADRRQITREARRESYGRLGQLVERLSPELRRRFLNSTLNQVAGHGEIAEEILGHWPKSVLLDALEQADTGRMEIPQTLLDVLGKLAVHRTGEAAQQQIAGRREHTPEEAAKLMELLFKGGESNRYVPADYRDALEILAAADVPTSLDRKQVDELLWTMGGHAIEQQFCSVMLDLVERGVSSRSAEAVTRNLTEMVGYFLETGDFASLNAIHDHLRRHVPRGEKSPGQPGVATLEAYETDEFVGQVLDGLDSWGKEQYPAIRELIGRVGAPFAAPLIERLAEETGMSRRRLFMECLQRIGSRAMDAVSEHLGDSRWYVVRNLVILLREINNPAALPALGRLTGHPHPKVQFEVMRTLLHFQDPRAERHLLGELESKDAEILLKAARLAAGIRNPAVASRLAELLNDRGNSEAELTLKSTIIKTIAEMGFVDVLEELEDFIERRSLFTSAMLTRVKCEAVASLPRYSDPSIADMAARIYRKSSGELARTAGQVCLQLRGSLP